MSVIVEHRSDHRGLVTSRCPRCDTQYIYWDEEDLDEDGNLHCFCDEDEEEGASYDTAANRLDRHLRQGAL